MKELDKRMFKWFERRLKYSFPDPKYNNLNKLDDNYLKRLAKRLEALDNSANNTSPIIEPVNEQKGEEL